MKKHWGVIFVVVIAALALYIWPGWQAAASGSDEMEQVVRGPRSTGEIRTESSAPQPERSWLGKLWDGITGFFRSLFGMDKRTGTVSAQYGLNVRKGPGVGNDRLGLLKNGEQVTILGEKNGWYRIKFDGRKGWISGKYVKIHGDDVIVPPDDSSDTPYIPPDEPDLDDFSYEMVMSDELYIDSDSMSSWEIQRFLEKKGSVLAEPYRGQMPSRLIYTACRKYGISPKVMLARLQTEQGLVRKKAATEHQLDWALGVGCYDSGNWNAKYKGFDKQVEYAAATMRKHYDRGRELIREQGTVRMTIDRRRYKVKNAATYSLYKYTPHRAGTRLFYDVFAGYFAMLLYLLLGIAIL